MWISWIDDMLCIGHPDDVKESKDAFMKIFACDDIGELKEYVGCKIHQTENSIKFTQPVLLQVIKMNFCYLIESMILLVNQETSYSK